MNFKNIILGLWVLCSAESVHALANIYLLNSTGAPLYFYAHFDSSSSRLPWTVIHPNGIGEIPMLDPDFRKPEHISRRPEDIYISSYAFPGASFVRSTSLKSLIKVFNDHYKDPEDVVLVYSVKNSGEWMNPFKVTLFETRYEKKYKFLENYRKNSDNTYDKINLGNDNSNDRVAPAPIIKDEPKAPETPKIVYDFNDPYTAFELFHGRKMPRNKNNKLEWYEVLGVDKNTPDNEIKKAYRQLSLNVHPDKHSDASGQEAIFWQEAFKILNNANDDSKKRSVFKK